MRKLLLLMMLVSGCLAVQAQERVDSIPVSHMRYEEPQMPMLPATDDSLHLPLLNDYGQVRPLGMYPCLWTGYDRWDLHRGLNVSMGASVFSSFDRHGSTGFAQNVALMYATPLTDKLSFSLGGYYSHFNYGRESFHDAGLNAVLGYQFDEHWEAYLYAQKSLTDRKRFMPLPLWELTNQGDRIGAAVKYNFSPSFSIQVSMEHREWMPWEAVRSVFSQRMAPYGW